MSVVAFQACVCVRSSSTCSRGMQTSNYSQTSLGRTHLSVLPLLATRFQMDGPGENGSFPLVFLPVAFCDCRGPGLLCASLSAVSALDHGPRSWRLPY